MLVDGSEKQTVRQRRAVAGAVGQQMGAVRTPPRRRSVRRQISIQRAGQFHRVLAAHAHGTFIAIY